MPTTQPRYTVTDTGAVRVMLDLAQQRWPEIDDRKALLLRLAAVGSEVIGPEAAERRRQRLRELQLAALARASDLVDAELLESDAASR